MRRSLTHPLGWAQDGGTYRRGHDRLFHQHHAPDLHEVVRGLFDSVSMV